MSAVSSSFVSVQNHKTHFLTGSSSRPVNHCIVNVTPSKLTSNKRTLVVRAGSGKSTAGIFVGGFVLGGIIVGALGCVYAPQGYTPITRHSSSKEESTCISTPNHALD